MKRTLLLLGFLAILLVPGVKADGSNWCNTSYDNRTAISLGNIGTSSVILTLNSTSVPFYDSLQKRGQDIFVCANDNTTRLEHYLEDDLIYPSGNSYLVVFPNGNSTIWIYGINNTAVGTYSNPENIAINGVGDNFDDSSLNTSKWTPEGSFPGTWTELASGRLQCSASGSNGLHGNTTTSALTYANITCKTRFNVTMGAVKEFEPLDWRLNDAWSQGYAVRSSTNEGIKLQRLESGWKNLSIMNNSNTITSNGTVQVWQNGTYVWAMINSTQTQFQTPFIANSTYPTGGYLGFYRQLDSANTNMADWDWVYCTNYTLTHTVSYSGTYDVRTGGDTTPPDLTWTSPPSNTSQTANVSWIYYNITISETPNTCILNVNTTSNYTMDKSGYYCSYNLTGLTNTTTYNAFVYANDSSGNMNKSTQKWVTVHLTEGDIGSNWCNNSYDYRTPISISNTYDGQVYLIINQTRVPFYDDLQKNGADIFFCANDNTTRLPHYLEDDVIYPDNSYVVVSVNSNETIWLYGINNTAVGTYSNPEEISINQIGDNFDDDSFNSTKWTIAYGDTGTWIESDGMLRGINTTNNGIVSALNITYTDISCKVRWNATISTAKEFEPLDWRVNGTNWGRAYGMRSSTAGGYGIKVLQDPPTGWTNLSLANTSDLITGNGTVQIWQNATSIKGQWNSTQGQWESPWILNSNYTTGGRLGFYKYSPTGYWNWAFCANYSQQVAVTYSGIEETRGSGDFNYPTVNLVSPSNGNQTATETTYPYIFNCSASDNVQLANISLWINSTGTWQQNQTASRTGIWNFSTFSLSLPPGYYVWNCKAADNSSNYNFAPANYTILVSLTGISMDVMVTYPSDGSIQTQNIAFIFNGTINCTSGDCGTVTAYPQYYSGGTGVYTVTSSTDFSNGSTLSSLTSDTQFNMLRLSTLSGTNTGNYTSRIFSKASSQSWERIEWADAPGTGSGWAKNATSPYISIRSGAVPDNVTIGSPRPISVWGSLTNSSIPMITLCEASANVGFYYKAMMYYGWTGSDMISMNTTTNGYVFPLPGLSWSPINQNEYCPNPFIENDPTTGNPVLWVFQDAFNGSCDVTGLWNMSLVTDYSTVQNYAGNPILSPGKYTQYDVQCSNNCHTSGIAKNYYGYVQKINGYYYMTWSVVGSDNQRRTVMLRSLDKFSGWENVSNSEFIPLGTAGSWDDYDISGTGSFLVVEDVSYHPYEGRSDSSVGTYQVGLCLQNNNNLTNPCIKYGVIMSNVPQASAMPAFYKGNLSEGWELWYMPQISSAWNVRKAKIDANLNVFVRYSGDNSSWGSWIAVNNGDSLTNTSNYMQVKMDFAGTDNSINVHYFNVTYTGESESWVTINDSTPVKTSSSVPYNCGVLNESQKLCYPTWTLNITTTSNYTYRILANSSEISNTSEDWAINVQAEADTTAPDITWTSPPSNNSQTSNVSWIFYNATISETPGKCYLNINGTSNITMDISGYYCYYNYTGLTNATTYCGRVYANDSSGNLNLSSSRCVSVNLQSSPDITPPTIIITSPTASLYNTASIWLNYTIGEVPAGVWYKLNGGNNISLIGYCYQETANQTTSCGLGTGSYSWSGDWATSGNVIGWAYDGIWNTSSWTRHTLEDYYRIGYFYVNYSKPTNSLSTSLWQVSTKLQGSNSGYYGVNYTIPSDCWNYYANNISFYFKKETSYQYPEDMFDGNVTFYCFNGSWRQLGFFDESGGAYDYITEEGMWWYIQSHFNTTITAQQGSNTVIVYANDTIGNIGSSSVAFTLDSIVPPLNFVSPTLSNSSYTSNQTWIYVNVSSNEALGGCLLNWVQNNTNITMGVTGSYCYANITGLVNGTSYYFRVYGNDTAGNLNKTVDRNITIRLQDIAIEYTQTQTAYTVEYINNTFILNVSMEVPVNFTATFMYDGNPYTPTETVINAYNSYFTVSVRSPTPSSSQQNYTWYWSILGETGYGNFTVDTSNQEQAVFQMILTNCSAGSLSTTKSIWFFLRDEETDAYLNGTLDITFNITDNYGYFRNHSFSFSNQTNYSICIYPTWASYYADVIGTYEATGYSTRSYYLSDYLLDNDTASINLYLSSNATTVLVTLTVQNSAGQLQDGIDIDIQRYYPGTGVYQSVQSVRTGYNGQAVAYMIPYDVWYRFILSRDGQIVLSVNPMVITSTTLTFTITEAASDTYFDYYGDVAYGCSTSETTNTTTCTVVDTSGNMEEASLVVKKWNGVGWLDVCEINSTSSSATLPCFFGDRNGLFWYSLTADMGSSTLPLESNTLDYRTAALYGSLGVLAALILIITLALLGAYRPQIALVLASIGLLISYAIGLITVSYGSIVAIFVVMGIAIFRMRGSTA